MRELIELTAAELDLVSGGAGVVAAGAGTISASAGSAENLGVAFFQSMGVTAIVQGSIIAGSAMVFGPATLAAVATANESSGAPGGGRRLPAARAREPRAGRSG
jgi:hypothetical protein